MSYYAHGAGDAKIKAGINTEEIKNAVRDLPLSNNSEFEYEFENETIWLSLTHSYFEEEDVLAWLNAIAPMISEGMIEFTGEDDAHWAYVFNTESTQWKIKTGRLVYGTDLSTCTTDELINELVKRKVNALVTTYSWGDTPCVRLFESNDEATTTLEKDFQNEVRIDMEENGYVEGDYYATRKEADSSYAHIAIERDYETDFTRWFVINIENGKDLSKMLADKK